MLLLLAMLTVMAISFQTLRRMQKDLLGQVLLPALLMVASHSLVDGFTKSLKHPLVTAMGHTLASRATSAHPWPRTYKAYINIRQPTVPGVSQGTEKKIKGALEVYQQVPESCREEF